MKSGLLICSALAGIIFTGCDQKKGSHSTHSVDTLQVQAHDAGVHIDDMMGMKKMMADMNAFKMTGDPDYDYAAMMIIHHQGAIDMAQVEVQKGDDFALKQMAQGMSDAQRSEIQQFESILKNIKPATSVNGHTHDGMKSMDDMMRQMTDMKMSGDIDRNFATMMIPHHEGAVVMSKGLLQSGKNAELKKIANMIIADQTREIVELKAWLGRG